MAAQFARPYHYQTRSNGPSQTAPNAALLIDFDNVTMGIRSDLSKELKSLLNSDIIKGKVAVQRAYADWRRYPQYVVHLAEASVDLIFAPAYGSAKKNATDIRLAIDALELVFTRPEIGTFILLSGDSDFSSLVLKLKEYGKYVIGVGIRESASDILVQNCDEYYSYSSLSGLTKESDEDRVRQDPWELVEKAVRLMAARRDVMRSDRLKQVMLELDGNFNEKELGYSKFSRFLSDAVARDKLRLRKGENGQWEVSPPGAETAPAQPVEAARPEARPAREESRGRRGGRGRDHERSQGERAPREPREDRVAAAPAAEAVPAPRVQAEPVTPAPAPTERPAAVQPPVEAREPKQRPAREEPVAGEPRGDLRAAYELLRRAVEHLIGRNGEMARDSDVKRRMLELYPGWDESALGFSKFSRFLRQAHDAEVIDLHRGEGGSYQLTISTSRGRKQVEITRPGGRGTAPAASRQQTPEPTTAPAVATEKPAAAETRKPVKVETRQVDPGKADKFAAYAEELAKQVEKSTAAAAAPVASADKPAPRAEKPTGKADKPASRIEVPVAAAADQPAPKAEQPAVTASPVTAQTAPAAAPAAERATTPAPRGIGARLGTRGRAAPAGPPPVLPGQAVTTGADSTKPEVTAEAAPEPKGAPMASAPAARDEVQAASKPKAPARREKAPVVDTSAPVLTLTERYGLPTDAKGVEAYILGRYKGVGVKTVAALIEAFGAGDLFGSLEAQPDRVREVLGGSRRADLVLEAWKADLAQRTESEVAEHPVVAKGEAAQPAAKPAKQASAKRPARRTTRKAEKTVEAGATEASAKPARRNTRAKAKPTAQAAKAAEATTEQAARPAPRRGRRTSKPKAPAGE